MNKSFVSIADDLLKKRTHVACDYNEFSLGSVKNDFIIKNISVSKILNYIITINPNKNVCLDVPSICFVKLSAKIISSYLSILI